MSVLGSVAEDAAQAIVRLRPEHYNAIVIVVESRPGGSTCGSCTSMTFVDTLVALNHYVDVCRRKIAECAQGGAS